MTGTEFATTGDLIGVARELLDIFDFECKTADAIREGDRRFRALPTMEIQNMTRTAVGVRIWKREGRQTMAMHPEVVREHKTTNHRSDHHADRRA